MEVDDVVDTIRRGIRCPIGLEAVWGMDRLTGKGAERKGTAVSVMEIKEALGKLSPAELAEVSAFIEGREADWLEQCGRTADERLRVKSWKVGTAARCGDFISEKIFRGRGRRFEFSQLVGTGKASHSEPTTPRWWGKRVPRAPVLRQHQEVAGERENSCWIDRRSSGVA